MLTPSLSEVIADDTPSVMVVLNSDTKRLKLMRELGELRDKMETQHDSDVLDRYNEVCLTLDSSTPM